MRRFVVRLLSFIMGVGALCGGITVAYASTVTVALTDIGDVISGGNPTGGQEYSLSPAVGGGDSVIIGVHDNYGSDIELQRWSSDGSTWTPWVSWGYTGATSLTGTAPSGGPWAYVEAIDGVGVGSLTLTSMSFVSATPAAPSGISVGSITSTGATASWGSVTGATSYTVLLNGSVYAADVTGTSYTMTGLSSGTSYAVSIEAVGSGGTSAASTPLSFSTLPAAPTGVTVSSVTTTSISVSWTVATGATSYNILLNGAILQTGITGTSYTITGLSPGTSYSTAVQSVDVSGLGTPSAAVSFSTQVGTLGSPSNVQVSGTSGGEGTVSWTAPSGAPTGTTYTIYQNSTALGTTTGTSYTLTNYDPYATYNVKASAAGYTTSTAQTNPLGGSIAVPFRATDLFRNGAALVASVGGLLLLVLTFVVGPWFVRFIRGTAKEQGRSHSESLVSPVTGGTVTSSVEADSVYRKSYDVKPVKEGLTYHD